MGSSRNACDLGTKIVGLISRKRWVANDLQTDNKFINDDLSKNHEATSLNHCESRVRLRYLTLKNVNKIPTKL